MSRASAEVRVRMYDNRVTRGTCVQYRQCGPAHSDCLRLHTIRAEMLDQLPLISALSPSPVVLRISDSWERRADGRHEGQGAVPFLPTVFTKDGLGQAKLTSHREERRRSRS
jgi:hypothetical protein